MIEEPPPLVFAPSIERPPADIVERLRAPTSFIVDAMNGMGALDWRIKRARRRPPRRRRAHLRLRPARQSGVHGGARRIQAGRRARRGDRRLYRRGGDWRPAPCMSRATAASRPLSPTALCATSTTSTPSACRSSPWASRRIRRNGAVPAPSGCRSSAAACRSRRGMWWSAIATAWSSFRARASRRRWKISSGSRPRRRRRSSACAAD